MTAPARFKQEDVTRALRAAASAGMRVARFEVEPSGKIVVISEGAAPATRRNAWDAELGNGQ